MRSRVFIPLVASVLLLVMGVFFVVNPSYEKSLRAKYYYETGDYKEAYSLAKEAFADDVYNRMAATVMTQSQTSLKYVGYIEDAKKYMTQIDDIALKESISDADKAKIKIMCQIMISAYIRLAPSVVTDKALVKEAAMYYEKFGELLEKVDRS